MRRLAYDVRTRTFSRTTAAKGKDDKMLSPSGELYDLTTLFVVLKILDSFCCCFDCAVSNQTVHPRVDSRILDPCWERWHDDPVTEFGISWCFCDGIFCGCRCTGQCCTHSGSHLNHLRMRGNHGSIVTRCRTVLNFGYGLSGRIIENYVLSFHKTAPAQF